MWHSISKQIREINWTLLALRTISFVQTVVSLTVGTTKKTYAALADAFSEEVYVFFKGDSTPYRSRRLISEGPGIPSVEWTYNKTTKTFTSSYTCSAETTRHKYLEWLSASVQYNGLNLYSLDDIIESTTVIHPNETMPSNEILVAAWALQSGVVLDKTIDLKLFIIHSSGKEETVSLWKQFQKSSAAVVSPTPVAKPSVKNEYFPPGSLRDDLPRETSNAIMRMSEKTRDFEDAQKIHEAMKSQITDISGVAEIGFAKTKNGVQEVDFEKVD
jgi:hypothetical protein